jgi:hypothetical protein
MRNPTFDPSKEESYNDTKIYELTVKVKYLFYHFYRF